MHTPAVVIVRVKSPWWAPKFLISRKFAEAVPEYAAAPGLVHKAFTFIDDCYGGVYEWRTRAQAEAWFDAKWHGRVKRLRGVEGDVRIFDVLTQSVRGPLEGTPLQRGAVRARAVVTQVLLDGAKTADAGQLLDWANGSQARRTSVVQGADGLSVISLWRARHEADASLADLSGVASMSRGRPPALVSEAPVVFDSAAR
jgi:hypothetical protein